MSWIIVKIGDVLKQYRIEHRVQNNTLYKQVSILNDGSVVLRGEKIGIEIGRKRQFLIDIKRYPRTLIFTRQLLLQGSIGIANEEVHNCIVTENMPMFSVDDSKIDIDYFALFIKSDVFRKQVRRVELTGSAQKSIHENTFLQLEIPLPSLKEQSEIVKIFSKFSSKNSEIRTELKNQHEFVNQLRQAFLREAMQGKLVPQNPADGNAKVLLQKIKAEKEKLIAGKKLKKEKELPPIKEEEIPFEIPENWVWCRLGEISSDLSYGTSEKADVVGEVPVLRMGNITLEGKILYSNLKYVSSEISDLPKLYLQNGDLVFNRTNSYELVGKSGVFENTEPYTLASYLIRVRFFSPVHSKFIANYINSKICRETQLEPQIIQQNGQANFNGTKLSNIIIPLPPIEEQNRIVKKLEDLMQHCNDLEASIKQSELQNEKLLQQVLREALSQPAGDAG